MPLICTFKQPRIQSSLSKKVRCVQNKTRFAKRLVIEMVAAAAGGRGGGGGTVLIDSFNRKSRVHPAIISERNSTPHCARLAS